VGNPVADKRNRIEILELDLGPELRLAELLDPESSVNLAAKWSFLAALASSALRRAGSETISISGVPARLKSTRESRSP